MTGECVGQVASQTLENMHAIETVSPLPVLRPLVAFDKEETIQFARRIGTYDLSVLPEPDCCTVFQPPKAALRARVVVCEDVERKLPMDEMIEEALEKSEALPL